MLCAKPPGLVVVRSTIRYPLGLIWQRIQMLQKLFTRNIPMNWSTVVHYVKIRFLKINDSVTGFIPYARVADVPLVRYSPIKHLSS